MGFAKTNANMLFVLRIHFCISLHAILSLASIGMELLSGNDRIKAPLSSLSYTTTSRDCQTPLGGADALQTQSHVARKKELNFLVGPGLQSSYLFRNNKILHTQPMELHASPQHYPL